MSSTPFPANTRLAAYLRDSGGDDQDLSIEQQEQAVRTWCAKNSLTLTRIFKDEAAPGSSTLGRTAFQEMIRYFHSGQVDEAGIVVWKFSRFAREINDSQFFKADLRRLGFTVHSLNDSIPEGLDGQFFEAAIDWMNAKYLDDLKTDVKRGVHHLVDQYGALGGLPPVGFIRSPVDLGAHRDGTPHIVHRWVPDPDKWELCRLAWQMRTNGATYTQIHAATHLYRSNASYRDFFTNRLYLGELKYGDQTILDYAPALITPEIWDRVQKISLGRSHRATIESSHGRKSSFRLSGLVHCAACGSPMYGSVIQFRIRDRDKGAYGYYACTLQNRTSGRECNAKKIPKIPLEDAVLKKTFDYLRSQEVIPIILGELNNQNTNQSQTDHAAEKIKAQQKASVQRRIGNIMNAIEVRGLSETLSARLDELEAEKQKLEKEIKPSPAPGKTYNLNRVLELLEELEERLKTWPPADANNFFRYITNGIYVERIDKTVFGRIEIVNFPLEISSIFMPGLGVPGVTLPAGINSSIQFSILIPARAPLPTSQTPG